ncbi:YciI family protein [Caulobacter sp. KR2-114]|uniref:YciI family protein n=1 Tax=Caulobacter sp. KR2-114 TaxID=3400912 RepID=UPI003C0C1E11
MRYLVIYRGEGREEGAMPDPEHMATMGRYVDESLKNGKLIGTEPLGVRELGARVRLKNGQYTVSDEPDRASGYAFLNAPSREAVIEMCKEFLGIAGDGVTEIRQIMEFGPPPAS